MEKLIEKARNVIIEIDKTSLSERLELEKYLNSIGFKVWDDEESFYMEDLYENYEEETTTLYLIYYDLENDWMTSENTVVNPVILKLNEVKQHFTPLTLKDIYE